MFSKKKTRRPHSKASLLHTVCSVLKFGPLQTFCLLLFVFTSNRLCFHFFCSIFGFKSNISQIYRFFFLSGHYDGRRANTRGSYKASQFPSLRLNLLFEIDCYSSVFCVNVVVDIKMELYETILRKTKNKTVDVLFFTVERLY